MKGNGTCDSNTSDMYMIQAPSYEAADDIHVPAKRNSKRAAKDRKSDSWSPEIWLRFGVGVVTILDGLTTGAVLPEGIPIYSSTYS